MYSLTFFIENFFYTKQKQTGFIYPFPTFTVCKKSQRLSILLESTFLLFQISKTINFLFKTTDKMAANLLPWHERPLTHFKTLFCFVYPSDLMIKNPEQFAFIFNKLLTAVAVLKLENIYVSVILPHQFISSFSSSFKIQRYIINGNFTACEHPGR